MGAEGKGSLVFVSTALPPAVCGVGSHTAKLREHWPASGRLLHLVEAGADDSAAFYGADEFVQFDRSAKSLRAKLECVSPQALFVQYAGRAYSRWGAPWWFYTAIRDWRRRHAKVPMLLYVHELWADLKITHRQYWFERLSRWMMGQLMDMSDVVVTNTENHRERMLSLRPQCEVMILPVGTNIVPAQEPLGLRHRDGFKEFVVFGLPYSRLYTLRVFKDWLLKWQQDGVMHRLHVIGPSDERWSSEEDQLLSGLCKEIVCKHGALPEKEVSELLSRCGFGLMAQRPESMTKSGSLMAFLSHGCAIVSPYAAPQMIKPVRWFVKPEELTASSDLVALTLERQESLKDWHDENAKWPKITERLAEVLKRERESQG